MERSIVLLSGGLDSCVACAIAKEETDVIGSVTVNYGQKHVREINSALRISQHYAIPHFDVYMGGFGDTLSMLHATALIDKSEDLPSDRRMSEMTAAVPRSYVPGRNTIMLALAQSLAEALDADCIYTGFNAVDYSGYPDCRPIFVEAWNHLARYATKRGYQNRPIELRAPIVNLSKASVVRRGLDLAAPLALSWSCYQGGDKPCGRCDSCVIRWAAFHDQGMKDPIGEYETEPKHTTL
jgi:7-cyano-7-deazaguanine synthase